MTTDDLFVEDRKELIALSKLKMPLKKEQLQRLKDILCVSGYTYYATLICKWRGKIVERYFAGRCRKNKHAEIQEVERRIEGNSLILTKNIYLTGASGYCVFWENSKDNFYFGKTAYSKWFIENKKYYRVGHFILYNDEEITKLDESLKYCHFVGDVDTGIGHYCSFTEWVTIYRKFPEIEMISRLGINFYCVNNYSFLTKLKDKAFRKFLVESAKEKGFYYTAQDFVIAFNHKYTSLKKYKEEKEANSFFKHFMKRYIENNRDTNIVEKIKNIDGEKLKKYFLKNIAIITPSSYYDLLAAEIFLKLDLTQEKNLFPHDFKYWHDFYTQQVKAFQNKEIDLKIKEQVKRYQKLEKTVDGLKFILAKSTIDLINEGKELNHCVGRMNYNKKIANDESLIIFVRENSEKALYTMEYDPHKREIIQFYGKNDSVVPTEIWQLVETKWLSKIKRLSF